MLYGLVAGSRFATAQNVVLVGGTRPEGPGAYYPPTVLSGLAGNDPILGIEIFGPLIERLVATVAAAEADSD